MYTENLMFVHHNVGTPLFGLENKLSYRRTSESNEGIYTKLNKSHKIEQGSRSARDFF